MLLKRSSSVDTDDEGGSRAGLSRAAAAAARPYQSRKWAEPVAHTTNCTQERVWGPDGFQNKPNFNKLH